MQPIPESVDSDPNPFRYCGEYWDSDTGEIYLRARTYDPRTGRFSAEDSVKDGANWYVYGNSNPVKLTDPSGLAATPGWALRIMNGGATNSDWSMALSYNGQHANYLRYQWTIISSAIQRAHSRQQFTSATQSTSYQREDAINFMDNFTLESEIIQSPRFGDNDCTNFVSRALNYAGLPMTDDWYFRFGIVWNGKYRATSILLQLGAFTESWSDASAQFEWIQSSDYIAGAPIEVSKNTNISDLIGKENIQPRDVIYWQRHDGKISHASMVYDVSNGKIGYAQHSDDKFYDLGLRLNEDTENYYNCVYVARIRD